MWRKSSREVDSINGSIRRSCSNRNFVRSSLKDVENLFANDDANSFNKTLDQPPPCSPTATTARRLSIFHRVHLANKFARAFATKESPNSEKSPPDSNNATAAEKLGKSDRTISISDLNNDVAEEKSAKSDRVFSIPDSNNAAAADKLLNSDRPISIPDLNNDLTAEKLEKSDRVISIPGAEKRVVLYTTSLRVVRPTFEACRSVQSILRGFRVSIDERDLSMDSRFLDELQNIMAEGGEDEIEKTKLNLPRVFIGGKYIGGAEEVKQLHETGELKKFVERLPPVTTGVCEICGDFRFILCDECSGSHKCYSEKGGFRSCTLCNENGLIRCPSCLDR